MTNIHEILKSFGLEIPADKKADFDKVVTENYKAAAEVEKINEKLTKEINDHKETKKTLETTNTAFEELKNSNASKEDWEKKYNDLVEENRVKAEEKANQKERIKIPTEKLRKYFPKNFSTSQIEEAIIKMCEAQYRKKQQQKER